MLHGKLLKNLGMVKDGCHSGISNIFGILQVIADCFLIYFKRSNFLFSYIKLHRIKNIFMKSVYETREQKNTFIEKAEKSWNSSLYSTSSNLKWEVQSI